MYLQVDKSKENKNRSVANDILHKENNEKRRSGFMYGRILENFSDSNLVKNNHLVKIVQCSKYIGRYTANANGNVRDENTHDKLASYNVGDEIEVTSTKTSKFSSKILSKEHVFGLVNGVEGWIVEDNIGTWLGNAHDIIYQNPPERLWDNIHARFETNNTSNNRGNSKYTVTRDDLYRYAPVNLAPDRNALNQVYHDSKNRHVAYTSDIKVLDKLFGEVFSDGVITYDDQYLIAVDDSGKYEKINISLAPQNGLTVIDFNYNPNTNKISGRHVGHAVTNLE
ncbi:hypothetical protein [Vibrio quintilis]|uniref:Uncharacterized protein n=1 Tax=Vibrio quintilis TaxID=1117707 RepID=A0A1M7YVD6_9VIBR|nr:hypothetical protein [Vibrio quintilis]SHO56647.1 hypothetical protein VQ7734_02416 [Vibrio quintilis]